MLTSRSSGKGEINVRDEREFKLWIKFILSIEKEGGDIKKPLNILWESVKRELEDSEIKRKGRDKIYQS
jgi:hypothetical protein